MIEDYVFIGTVITAVLSVVIYLIFLSGRGIKASTFHDVSKSLLKEENATIQNKVPGNDEKVLSPIEFRKFKLIGITDISHNTKLLKFEIPFGKSIGLSIGRHISVRAEVDGNKVIRAYTPTSRPDKRGYFDLLVKAYEYGKMSTYLHSLTIGSEIEVRGPVGRFKYSANSYSRIGLIAGGTGMTPCLQVLRFVLEGPEAHLDNTNFTLLFQNRTVDDILLRKELDDLQATFPTRLKIFYFLSNPHSDWGSRERELRGYINEAVMDNLMKPATCPYVCLCGPSGFNEAMKGLLVKTGHSEESIYVW